MPVPSHRDTYQLSILVSLSGTLLLCIALVKWWPIEPNYSLQITPATEDEVVQIQTVMPTDQRIAPPPPPPATVAPPISVPNEMIPTEEPLDLDITWTSSSGDGQNSENGEYGQDTTGTRFSREAPQPIHFAEPIYPNAAWQQGICAQIVVEVTVDQKGRAKTHRIIDRYLLKRDTSTRSVSAACCSRQIMKRELVNTADRARVNHLGHGLEEAALGAAWKWRFAPPTKEGKTLSSSAVLTFTFGR